jgi:flagellar motor component MotA
VTLHLRSVDIYLYFCAVVICSLGATGCYSFTGASVPQHWKSIAIPLFEDESNYGQPALRERITNLLIEKFQRDNTLVLSNRSSSTVEMKGTIISIEADQPIAVSQGTQAARLQVTIKARVSLTDHTTKKETWNKTFTAAGDYLPSGGPVAREAGLEQAVEKLTDDVLLETLSAW